MNDRRRAATLDESRAGFRLAVSVCVCVCVWGRGVQVEGGPGGPRRPGRGTTPVAATVIDHGPATEQGGTSAALFVMNKMRKEGEEKKRERRATGGGPHHLGTATPVRSLEARSSRSSSVSSSCSSGRFSSSSSSLVSSPLAFFRSVGHLRFPPRLVPLQEMRRKWKKIAVPPAPGPPTATAETSSSSSSSSCSFFSPPSSYSVVVGPTPNQQGNPVGWQPRALRGHSHDSPSSSSSQNSNGKCVLKEHRCMALSWQCGLLGRRGGRRNFRRRRRRRRRRRNCVRSPKVGAASPSKNSRCDVAIGRVAPWPPPPGPPPTRSWVLQRFLLSRNRNEPNPFNNRLRPPFFFLEKKITLRFFYFRSLVFLPTKVEASGCPEGVRGGGGRGWRAREKKNKRKTPTAGDASLVLVPRRPLTKKKQQNNN